MTTTQLQPAYEVMALAERLLDDLESWQNNPRRFEDYKPYVLETLLRVTSLVNERVKPKPPNFQSWWDSLRAPPADARFSFKAIKAARDHELKKRISTTAKHVHLGITDREMITDFHDAERDPATGDLFVEWDVEVVAAVYWFEKGPELGWLAGAEVYPALCEYLAYLKDEILPKAESLISSG